MLTADNVTPPSSNNEKKKQRKLTERIAKHKRYIRYDLEGGYVMLSDLQADIAKEFANNLTPQQVADKLKCRYGYIIKLMNGNVCPKNFLEVVHHMKKFKTEFTLAKLYDDIPEQLEKAKAVSPLEWFKCIAYVKQVYPFVKSMNPNAPKDNKNKPDAPPKIDKSDKIRKAAEIIKDNT